MSVPTLSLNIDAFGKGTVMIDGKDISNAIEEIDIHIRAGQPPMVVMRPTRVMNIRTSAPLVQHAD